jgi:hypothetical protein
MGFLCLWRGVGEGVVGPEFPLFRRAAKGAKAHRRGDFWINLHVHI